LARSDSLFRSVDGLFGPGPVRTRRPRRDHRAGGGEPLFRGCDRRFRPGGLFRPGPPGAGVEDFEAAEGGAVWRFHNEGNRAFFVAHPEIYGPQFGGYDPIDVARGVTFAGNPRFWVISEQRLYLFGLETNRDAFAANPDHFLWKANARWPALVQNLVQ